MFRSHGYQRKTRHDNFRLLDYRTHELHTRGRGNRTLATHTRDTKETNLDIRRESSKLDRRRDLAFLEPFRGGFQVIANGERALSGGVLQFDFRVEQHQWRCYIKI